jgi:class 3 adenylate cyclase
MDALAGRAAPPAGSAPTLRFWQRLGVRLATLFALVTLLAVVLVGLVVYQRQKREVEDAVGTQLLNIARIGALLVEPRLHDEAQATRGEDSNAYTRVRKALAAIRTEAVLPTPIYTLALDGGVKGARVVVTSDEQLSPGDANALAPEVTERLAWTFEDGVARYTRIYHNGNGMWISAFAPITGEPGKKIAVLVVDYPLEIYLDRLRELQVTILQASIAGALAAALIGLLLARRITRPVSALTRGVARVAEGDLSQALPVQSTDEVGVLTRAFNGMIEGLRQRDFIRNTFGRYVSPEVVKALLDSPEGLQLGGEKRVVTILMSDLRGYTRFAEQGDPAWVMEVLNGYLARMTDIVVEHGGTINEFIGDAIFAIFGAPIRHPDHAERAAATALAMQRAMAEVNATHAARGLPRFEMGIGVNTGEAVVGNIGSEARAKYAVVGSAVNIAARVEGATVGGQIFLSAATYAQIRDLAEVAPPLSVELKGLSAPLLLYELRGVSGAFAQRLPETTAEDEEQVAVTLPVTCSVLDGKEIRKEGIEGVLVRLGRRHVDARLAAPLAPLTNVRLRLRYPPHGRDSGDLYGKVIAGQAQADASVTVIRLTSVDLPDQQVIEQLLGGKTQA